MITARVGSSLSSTDTYGESESAHHSAVSINGIVYYHVHMGDLCLCIHTCITFGISITITCCSESHLVLALLMA